MASEFLYYLLVKFEFMIAFGNLKFRLCHRFFYLSICHFDVVALILVLHLSYRLTYFHILYYFYLYQKCQFLLTSVLKPFLMAVRLEIHLRSRIRSDPVIYLEQRRAVNYRSRPA